MKMEHSHLKLSGLRINRIQCRLDFVNQIFKYCGYYYISRKKKERYSDTCEGSNFDLDTELCIKNQNQYYLTM